jgi:hypothetical protein
MAVDDLPVRAIGGGGGVGVQPSTSRDHRL